MKTFSIRLDENLLLELKQVSAIEGETISDLIRKGIQRIVEEKKETTHYRLSNFIEMSQKETTEILSEIDKLSFDDLQIVKRKQVKL